MKAGLVLGLIAALALAGPGFAQGADGIGGEGYQFMKAVKDRDILKAKGFIDHPGSTVVNSKGEDGATPLILVTKDRDVSWMSFLISEGADTNARDKAGNTPIIVAADQHFGDGVRILIAAGAQVDAQNRDGETALIKAVQSHDVPLVRTLVENGANPDKTDNVAGLSARDYATQDRRSTIIARLLDEAKPARAAHATAAATAAPPAPAPKP